MVEWIGACMGMILVLEILHNGINAEKWIGDGRAVLNGSECQSGGWYQSERSDGFLVCDGASGKYVFHRCPMVNGVQKLFDLSQQQCVYPKRRTKRTPGVPRSSGYGEACYFNTDCMSTMHCPRGTCQCINWHIAIGRDCMPMINPGQTGCRFTEQCTAVWPTTRCVDNTCRCDMTSSGLPTAPVTTRDGVVCVADGHCPLPEGLLFTALTPQLSLDIDAPIGPTGQCEYEGTDTEDPLTSCSWFVPPAGTQRNYLGDIYDCIQKSPVTTPADREGICCPNRALACTQPKEDAPSTANPATLQNRYWFNSITGQCESFVWSDSETAQSANAFTNLEHCQLYCGTTCRHAPVQYAPSNRSPGLENRPLKCQNGAPCGTGLGDLRFVCTVVGSDELCCASPESICSRSGGRDYGTPGMVQFTTNFDPGYDIQGVTPPVNDVETRYYFDVTTRRCTSFSYGRYGGNFNNFLSAADCEAYCGNQGSASCGRGVPLADASGNAQRCGGQLRCPTTHECRSNICCPTRQMICNQRRATGVGCPSTSSSIRYWYNVQSKECESFVYGGCNGNDNSFESYATCIRYCQGVQQEPKCPQGTADKDSAGNFLRCTQSGASSGCRANYECVFDGQIFGCCPARSYTCNLRPSTGVACGPPATRWYYDSTARTCSTITFLGCDGNSNSFATRDQCLAYCQESTGCPFGGQPLPDENDSRRPRTCSVNGTANRCPSDHVCYQIQFGSGLIDACCPTRGRLCWEFPRSGTACLAVPVQRYYYNVVLRRCQTFTYLGCDGNTNNFRSVSECRLFCGSAACDPGEVAMIDSTTGEVQTCSTLISNTCPSDHTCRSESSSGRAVCCGSPDPEGLCPSTERPFLDAMTGSARTCTPGATGSCPRAYTCRINPRQGRYYCCAPRSTPNEQVCQLGQIPYRDPVTEAVRKCSRVTASDPLCPVGYQCQFSGANTVGICCGLKGGCPGTSTAQINPTTNLQLLCQPQTTGICATGYECVQLQNENIFGCCTSTAVVTTTIVPPTVGPGVEAPLCPRGRPLPDAFAPNGYAICSPAVNCPTDYECTNTVLGNICCPGHRIICLQPLTSGTVCSTMQQRYHFDQRSGACRTFWYGGCDGNDNNFASRPDCEYCIEGMCPQGRPLLNPASATVIYCSTNPSLCGPNYECRTPLYGPTTFRLCCPRPETYCTLPSDSGVSCPASTNPPRGSQRYFYNPLLQNCQTFQYFGCGGNANRFLTRADCLVWCRSVGAGGGNTGSRYCQVGWTVYTEPSTSTPRSCLLQRCPAGSMCRYSPWRRMYYCCMPSTRGSTPKNDKLEIMKNFIQAVWPVMMKKSAKSGGEKADGGQVAEESGKAVNETKVEEKAIEKEGGPKVSLCRSRIQKAARPSRWTICTVSTYIECPMGQHCEYHRSTKRIRCCRTQIAEDRRRKEGGGTMT